MPTYRSSQATKIASPDFDMLKPNEAQGRSRIAYFDYTVPVGGLLIADVLELNKVPVGARIIGGNIAFSAFGASATASVGYSGAATRYKALTSIAAAGNFAIAGTIAENYGDELTAEQLLLITFAGANPPAAAVIKGHVEYVVD